MVRRLPHPWGESIPGPGRGEHRNRRGAGPASARRDAWSPCSWVRTIAATRPELEPDDSARRSISRALNPASSSRATPSDSTAKQFPRDPEPSTNSAHHSPISAVEGPLERAPTLRRSCRTLRRVITRSATRRNPSCVIRSAPSQPHANGGTYLGGAAACRTRWRPRRHDGAGREHRADRGLGVVAEERAEVLAAGLDALARDLEPDRAVGVLEIGRGGAGAEVHPVADDAVADEAVVALVGVAEEDATPRSRRGPGTPGRTPRRG